MTNTDVIYSFLVTWTVGLLPPAVLRYLIFRRPISQSSALKISFGLALVEGLFFILLGSQSKSHFVLVFIGIASYRILQAKGKTNVGTKESAEARSLTGVDANEFSDSHTLTANPSKINTIVRAVAILSNLVVLLFAIYLFFEESWPMSLKDTIALAFITVAPTSAIFTILMRNEQPTGSEQINRP